MTRRLNELILHTGKRRMLPVLDFDPAIGPAATCGSSRAFRRSVQACSFPILCYYIKRPMKIARQYPNDAMTAKVRRALKSGRKMRRDADGWLVDAKTGELIGPDPKIEKPLTKAQAAKAVVRRGRPPKPDRKQTTTLRLDPDVIEYFRKDGPGWQTRIGEVLRRAVKRSAR